MDYRYMQNTLKKKLPIYLIKIMPMEELILLDIDLLKIKYYCL